MKRGALITSGILVIGLVLFAMSALTLEQRTLFKGQAVQLAQMHRVNALFGSVAQSVAKSFNATPTMTITTTNEYISFTEVLPHETEFTSEFAALKTFIESNDEHITLDADALNPLTLQLKPQNLEYIHTADNQIEVRAETLPGNRYTITLNINREITSCDYSEDAGDFELEIVAEGTSGECSSTHMVDPNGETSIQIETSEEPVTIELNNADLLITGAELTATTTLWYNRTDEAREVRLGQDSLISVSVPRFNLVRTSNALLLTW